MYQSFLTRMSAYVMFATLLPRSSLTRPFYSPKGSPPKESGARPIHFYST